MTDRGSTMKAIVYGRYGLDALEIREIDRPDSRMIRC